jgi:hypothetical protein
VPSRQKVSELSAPSSPSIQDAHGSQLSFQGSEARSEAGSVASERGVQASILGVRRRAEEVAEALEERMSGFVLSDGEELGGRGYLGRNGG